MASPAAPVDLSPLPVRDRPLSRFAQLIGGLALYGTSLALMVRAELGLSPWSVLDQGIALRAGWSLGTASAITGVGVLLAWLPLRQRPGIGTVANVVLIAISLDAVLAVLPEARGPASQVLFCVAGVVLNGLATASYVGARLGPGPRDGLMTGLHARTGKSVRACRTTIEIGVLASGWLLGGTVGVGTVLYAATIGPITQACLRFTAVRVKKDLRP
ncbi:YczE/YyaS/YitT family protein [Saccharopolyspora griseoalba]|uniref:YitT family protein n=1 Tax=Saccharopolyspora griseoalba TaxID=1431848 RepID=A0ABW2LIT6_9PSEU